MARSTKKASGKKKSGRARATAKATPRLAASSRAREDEPRHPAKPLSGPEARRQLERVRALCLALPGASEKIAWGAATFRAPKVFAMFADHHHGDGRVALWCPAEKGAQEVLAGAEPERYFRPPYVGPSGWIGIVLTAIDDARLEELVREAWRLVAPKRRDGAAR